MSRLLAATLILAFGSVGAGCSAASAAVKGFIFQSKGGESPLLVWDATPAIVDIVSDKTPREDALHGLEASALDAISERLPTLSGAKRVTIKVIYQKVGAINPEYGTPTFQGVENLFELTVDAGVVQSSHQTLVQSLTSGKVPSTVDLKVTGSIPPV